MNHRFYCQLTIASLVVLAPAVGQAKRSANGATVKPVAPPVARKVFTIPFEYDPEDGSMLVTATLYPKNLPKQTARFVFDTGYAGVITASDRLHLGKPTGTMNFISHSGVGSKQSYTINKLEMGDYVMSEKVEVPEDDSRSGDDGKPIDGLIGLSAWWNYVTEINYQNKVIRLHPRESVDLYKKPTDNAKKFLVPFDPTSGSFFIFMPTKIAGKKGKMIIDTGAQGFFAVIYKHSAKAWDLWLDNPNFIGQGMDASGVQDEYDTYVKDIEIGPMKVDAGYATVMMVDSSSQNSYGVFGSKFLDHYNIWVDFRGRVLYFERWNDAGFVPQEGSTGISFLYYNPLTKYFHAFGVKKGSPAAVAGIENRDPVIAVNGEEVTRANLRRMKLALNHGKVGEKVKVLVSRKGSDKTFELERKVLINGDPPTVGETKTDP